MMLLSSWWSDSSASLLVSCVCRNSIVWVTLQGSRGTARSRRAGWSSGAAVGQRDGAAGEPPATRPDGPGSVRLNSNGVAGIREDVVGANCKHRS